MQQRLRLVFSKGERVRFISHLDVLRYWERVIRRAGLPLTYSKGFTPHPRLTFAGPLPLGFLGEHELMDLVLEERVAIADAEEAMAAQSSEDLSVISLAEVPTSAPALQAVLRHADFRAAMPGLEPEAAEAAVGQFLALDSFEWVDQRKDKERIYDLRAGVAELSSAGGCGGVELRMRLAAHQDFTVRPEQVVQAVFPGAEPGTFVRERLLLEERSLARELWRRRGQYLDERPGR